MSENIGDRQPTDANSDSTRRTAPPPPPFGQPLYGPYPGPGPGPRWPVPHAPVILPPAWAVVYSDPAPAMGPVAGLLILATGVASGWLLDAGYGFTIPALAFLLGATAIATGRSAGRGPGRRGIGWWSGIWGASCLALLCAAAWWGEPGPYWLAVVCALMTGALATHGGRGWRAVLLAPVGLTMSTSNVFLWALRGLRNLPMRGRSGMRNAGYAVLASLALVIVSARWRRTGRPRPSCGSRSVSAVRCPSGTAPRRRYGGTGGKPGPRSRSVARRRCARCAFWR